MKYQKEFVTDFTRVHNEFLRDKTLSLAARGVLITLLQLPDSWNLSEKTIRSILPDGQKKVSTALKECEAKGYICREKIVDEKGQIVDMIYHVSDQKLPSSILEKSFRKGISRVVDAVKKIIDSKQSYSTEENPQVEKVEMVSAETENRTDIKRDNQCKDYWCNHQSIRTDEIEAEIKQNISYEYLCDRYGVGRVDEIVGIMVSIMTSTKEKIRCNGEEVCTFSVQNTFRKLKEFHIEYVFECIENVKTTIHNIRAYLITTLYNSFFTMNNHVATDCKLIC